MRELSIFSGSVVQSVCDGTEKRCRQDGNAVVIFIYHWGNVVKGGALLWQMKSSQSTQEEKRQVVR